MKKWFKKCKKDKRKQLNNSGFTLIELILAMIVLAIIVSPFLHAFMTSTRINVKARQKSQATTLAQSVMEGLRTEAYVQNAAGEYSDVTLPHLENVLYQFTYPTLNNALDNFYILPKDVLTSASMGEISIGQASIQSADAGLNYKFTENSDMKYYLYLLDVKQQGTSFDILITLDGSAYGETATSGQNYNATDLVQIPSIDTKYDAVCTKNFDGEAYAEFQSKVSIYGATFDYGKVERTITINIITDGTGKVRATAKYDYEYYVNNTTTFDYNCQEVTIFSGSAADFRNVYLYYFPNYGSTNTNVRDKIVVNNNNLSDPSFGNDPYAFDFYIIKQRDESLNETDLKMKENNYRCYVTIKDTVVSESLTSPVQIRTNLGSNLYGAYHSGSGIDYKVSNQAIYFHNKIAYSKNDADSRYGINVVTNKNKKTAYLEATISVYEHSLTGTPTLTDFSSKLPLVTIDGSFVN